MKRTFRIQFLRRAEDGDKGCLIEEESGNYVVDETELDADGTDTAMILGDMINLFNNFCDEFGFKDVSVTQVLEVPYDGEEE